MTFDRPREGLGCPSEFGKKGLGGAGGRAHRGTSSMSRKNSDDGGATPDDVLALQRAEQRICDLDSVAKNYYCALEKIAGLHHPDAARLTVQIAREAMRKPGG